MTTEVVVGDADLMGSQTDGIGTSNALDGLSPMGEADSTGSQTEIIEIPDPRFEAELHQRETELLAEMGINPDIGVLLNSVSLNTPITDELKDSIVLSITGLLAEVRAIGIRASKQTGIRYWIIGRLLNRAEAEIKPKAQYMKWLRQNFKSELGLEALRQAKRIAHLGPYALDGINRGCNKNMMLEWYYLFGKMPDIKRDKNGMIISERMNRLLREYDLFDPDSIDVNESEASRTRIDTVVTIFRLQENGIGDDICSIEYARMIALYRTKAIEPVQALKLKEWLDNQIKVRTDLGQTGNETQWKKEDFQKWVLNRMVFPVTASNPVQKKRIHSITKQMVEESLRYCEDDVLVSELTEEDMAMLLRAKTQIEKIISRKNQNNNVVNPAA